ncbi:MAG: lipid A-modifier LpxR family protein [Pseudomonadota bacterium]
MRLGALTAMIGLAGLCAGTAQAQSWVDQGWREASAAPGAGRQSLPRDTLSTPDRGFGAEANLSPWAATSRDVWIEGDGHTDRLRVSRRSSEPAPLDPGARDAVDYDVSYIRGWTSTLGYTADGMAVTFTPHAGFGMGESGGVAEAGATVRIGRDLVPDGQEQFGDRARWYIYAAGSGRAVGYNFARTRDGDYARSGVSHDAGAFLGDAQLGVAMRRGAMQSSVGLVYREIEPGGMRRGIGGIDTDVSEGMFAFQLSIKPE